VFSAPVDLDAYCARIGYSGSRQPTRDTLDAILARHTATIPFENLNPLLGWPVRLDTPSLQRKLVEDRRGGYCFEHNLLLGHVLTAMGFAVTGLSARVRWKTDPGVVRPRTHMLLRIDLADGTPLVADGGFGGPGLTGSLLLQPAVTQETPHDRYRLVPEGRGLRLDLLLPSGTATLYAFDPDPAALADYEMGNWFVSTHPQSMFVTTLVVALAGPRTRLTLRNRDLVVRRADGVIERTVLPDVQAIRDVLTGTFGLRLPDDPQLDAAIARAVATDTPVPALAIDVPPSG
jgi:N-hydroxyarylamine O-acetyltransferase